MFVVVMLLEVSAIVSGAVLFGVSNIPHCASMCGPLSSAVCMRSQSRAAALRYQGGRVVGYGFVGLLAGRFGMALSAILAVRNATWVFAVVTAASCLWVASRLWPRPGGGAKRLTPGFTEPQRPYAGRISRKVLTVLPREPAAVGVLSALLPCGALAAAVLLAAASGKGWLGALFMSTFAIVSGVGVFSMSSVVAWMQRGTGGQLLNARRGMALCLVAFALFSLRGPLQDAWLDEPGGEPAAACH